MQLLISLAALYSRLIGLTENGQVMAAAVDPTTFRFGANVALVADLFEMGAEMAASVSLWQGAVKADLAPQERLVTEKLPPPAVPRPHRPRHPSQRAVSPDSAGRLRRDAPR